MEFDSFTNLIEAPPPNGLGAKYQQILDLCRHRKDVLNLLDGCVQRSYGGSRSKKNKSKAQSKVSSMHLDVKRETTPEAQSKLYNIQLDDIKKNEALEKETIPEAHSKLYNIQVDNNVEKIKYPSGTSSQAGLRKLRKHAEKREDVAKAYEQALKGEISTNKALIQTGLRKPPAPSLVSASMQAIAEKLVQTRERNHSHPFGESCW